MKVTPQQRQARNVVKRRLGLLSSSNAKLVSELEKQFGVSANAVKSKQDHRRFILKCAMNLGWMDPVKPEPRKQKKKPEQPVDKAKKFYKSFEWRRVRYEALRKNNGCCELCGRSKNEGAVLNVDHIKPLRTNWHLRFEIDNLQVLCGLCNHGKGNTYSDDWRGPRLAVVLGERVDFREQ